MDAVVVDTNVVSFILRGDSRGEDYRPHLEGKTLAISFMTVAELYEGAYRARWGKRKMSKLEDELKNYLVIPFSNNVCLCWAKLRAERKSAPISVDDGWIAATALAHNLDLVTHNPGDFHGITGLRIISELV